MPATQARAIQRTARQSPYKMRLVIDQIRGMGVNEALALLKFSKKHAAKQIAKVLTSAVANAESAHGLDGDELVVLEAYADEGPTLKRWRARARGRVNRIKKRTCHITIVVAESPKSGRPRPQKPAKPAAEQAPAPETPAAEEPAAEEKPKRRAPAKKKEAVA